MKLFIIQLLITLILAIILSLWLPFWGVSLAAFAAALIIKNKIFFSFLAGFLGIALLWAFTTLIFSTGNDNIMLSRVAAIFSLSPLPMILVLSLVGGLLGGFAAATATQFKIMFRKERPNWHPRYR